MTAPPTYRVADGVYGIDVGPDGTSSTYLVVDDEPTLVDAATASSVDDIVAALRDVGVAPETLSNVVVSHVHLDHSGAAGGLAAVAPDLDVYVHESTTVHLVDPTRLVESTKAVLGDEFERMGAPDPLSDRRIEPVPDEGLVIDCGERTLEVVHTPGHSPDHVSVWDPVSRVAFANEAIGRYYPEADCWVPPVTMPRFDAAGVFDAVETLRAYEPGQVALSHVGTVDGDGVFARAESRLEEFTERITTWFDETGDVDETVRRVRERLLALDEGYPERVVSTQADICTRGVLTDCGEL